MQSDNFLSSVKIGRYVLPPALHITYKVISFMWLVENHRLASD